MVSLLIDNPFRLVMAQMLYRDICTDRDLASTTASPPHSEGAGAGLIDRLQ